MTKNTAIAIAIFFVVGFIMGAMLRGCNGFAGGKIALIKSDTVVTWAKRTDTAYKTVERTHYIPYSVTGHDTIYQKLIERIIGHDTAWLTQYIHLSDTAAYKDTLRLNNEFKAEIFDTLAYNRIVGREVRWANLSPIKVETVTNTVEKKQPLVKVYLGLDAYAHTGRPFDADIAPATSIVIKDRYMVDLGYYMLNQQVQAGLKIKLSFRK